MQKAVKPQRVACCKECGAPIQLNQGSNGAQPICMPCKAHNMTVAFMKYPVCGFGEE